MLRSRETDERALIVAFETTASALVFNLSAQEVGLSGRLIPIPRMLSAGCGMAWRDDLAARAMVESIIENEEIDDARIVVMNAQ